MVARAGVKTVQYGTVITPCVVKDILGALPKKEFLASSPALLDTKQKLSYLVSLLLFHLKGLGATRKLFNLIISVLKGD